MRFNLINLSLILIFGFSVSKLAAANELSVFTASQNCPATPSIKKSNNPGNIHVEQGNKYPALKLNKPAGSFVQIQIDGASPVERWVSLACGKVANAVDTNTNDPGMNTTSTTTSTGASSLSTNNLLVLSWQPAFCEGHQNKPECSSETAARFDATHFTLHGLWPQPNGKFYCNGVSRQDINNDEKKDWGSLPMPPGLTSDTKAKLEENMPGTASNLERHEWIKHGTCFGASDADSYFRTAMALQNQVNASQLQKYMESNISKPVTVSGITQAFEQTFGSGSAASLEISCSMDQNSKRNLITEIQISLKGELTPTTQLGSVLAGSGSGASKCKNPVVDPVDFQ